MSLPGTGAIVVAPDVVTAEEARAMFRWARDRHRHGRLRPDPRDARSHVTPFLAADGTSIQPATVPPWGAVPDEFWAVRERVVDRYGLHGVPEDPERGAYLSYLERGGRVPENREARLGSDLALRCDVLIRRSRSGGLPIISGYEISVPERGAWLFYTSEQYQSAKPVSEPRATLSYGFAVAPGLPEPTDGSVHVAVV